ncbi:DnaD domain protein [Bacillus sp. ISL-45]|uniref:DnaD domain-containing protein n=1 Tax=Bacillus sp. ISL-45 TaxID=2819128 RepID=UPI001BEAF816|nr:DnaD domain protein [Bacillus sp. ISL-45]MBT2661919.1 DnaD domain protein [Bacillus sp. ISL-45]
MNYIKELNAFYDWLEINELSPSAINLWYALMHINNKAAWAETFTVAESVLCVKTGLTDRTLRKVRNELKQKGRIDFISRKGGKAPIYKLLSFYSTENNSVHLIPTEINSGDSAGDSAGGSAGDSSALNKLNETKLNKIKTTAASRTNYADEYTLCFGGHPSPIQIQEINSFIDQDGLSIEVVCIAFKKAAEVGAKYPYARSILNSWANKGIRTIADVDNEQATHDLHKHQQRNRPRKGTSSRTEALPEWFRKKENITPPASNEEDNENFEIEKAKLEEELRQFKRVK